jgi:hypothetical protein
MNKFKNNTLLKSLLLLMFLAPFSQSCTNLDEDIFDSLTESNFPTTQGQFIAALGATYTSLYGWANHNSIFSLQEIASDEMMIPHRGADWFDGGQWLRVHRHNYTPNEEAINNGWGFLYGGVNNCNRVIDLFNKLVDDGKVPQDQAESFIAEVRTLRALFYFWLLDAYGNVPIVTTFADADPNPATRNRADVYAFIESELNASVPKLTTDKGGAAYARMNYWSGKFLQAKLYLNAQVYTGTAQWDKADAALTEIINSGRYSLESDYFANFNTNNSGSNENIFVIPYDEAQAQGFNIAQMTLHYSSQSTFKLQAQPWNGYCTLQEFYNSYNDNDKRKGISGNQRVRGNFIAGPQFSAEGDPLIDSSADDPDGPPLNFTPQVNALEPNCYRQAGARVGKFEYAIGATPNLSNDFPLFRYADVILMKAEVLWRKNNNDANVLTLVNQVRSRAGLSTLTSITPQELLTERGREMFYEGWRRQDLIRFGAYNNAWAFKNPSDPTKNLFPIPQNALNANPNLRQNPGY